MSSGLNEVGRSRKLSDTKYSSDFYHPVAGDGDAVVDWGIKAEVIVTGFARGTHAIEFDFGGTRILYELEASICKRSPLPL